MDWQNKRVLVTGAGGFIGSHLTETLIDLGAKVKAFVRYNSRNDYGMIEILPDKIKKKIEVIIGDLKDSDAVYKATEDIKIIFHLGALIAIPYSYIHPREVIETNIIGTLNILSAARKNKIEKVVHTSTSEVYGTGEYIPIDEGHPLKGQSPYSASKIGADKLAESFYRSFDLPVAIIRPFNTYGPRQSTRAVIPTIITQALKQNRVFLGSLHPVRDFLYIDDAIEGFIKIAECDKSIGETVNIGSGIGISIGDLTKKILTMILTGKAIKTVSQTERVRPQKSEVGRLVADNSKAKEFLKWKPKISLDEGLIRTIEWVKENINRLKSEDYNL